MQNPLTFTAALTGSCAPWKNVDYYAQQRNDRNFGSLLILVLTTGRFSGGYGGREAMPSAAMGGAALHAPAILFIHSIEAEMVGFEARALGCGGSSRARCHA
jgi:hypothetical protein